MKFKITFYLIVLLLFSCSEDEIDKVEDTIKTSLITIKSTENLNQEETWLIISNDMGNVLAYGELEKDSTFVTDGKVEGSLNISFLSVSEDRYSMETYTDIPLDETWLIKDNSHVSSGEQNLTASIKVENILESKKNFYPFSISNALGSLFKSSSSTSGNSTFEISMNENAPKDILFVFTDGTALPVYSWLPENLLIEKSLDLDYQTDFAQMDHTLSYSFNNIKNQYMEITAYKEETRPTYLALNGYIMAEFFSFDEESSFELKVGYLDGFDFYRTRWSADFSGDRYFYTKFGGPPKAFTKDLFDSDFEIVNSTYNDFQFTTTGDFDAASGEWQSEDKKTTWHIHFPVEKSKNLILSDLPIEIKAKYPDLSFTNLIYKGSNFTDMIENKGYFSFIDINFKNEADKNNVEYYTISKYPD